MYKWLIFWGLAFVACKGPTSLPGNVLDYNEMKGILWDMAQVDEFVGFNVRGTPQKIKNESLSLYQKVFALHKISADEFVKSYSFYKSHPLQEKILMDTLSQFSARQHLDRFQPTAPKKAPNIVNPITLRLENVPTDWHQYQFQTNFWYEL